jgi:hypothetical protein
VVKRLQTAVDGPVMGHMALCVPGAGVLTSGASRFPRKGSRFYGRRTPSSSQPACRRATSHGATRRGVGVVGRSSTLDDGAVVGAKRGFLEADDGPRTRDLRLGKPIRRRRPVTTVGKYPCCCHGNRGSRPKVPRTLRASFRRRLCRECAAGPSGRRRPMLRTGPLLAGDRRRPCRSRATSAA